MYVPIMEDLPYKDSIRLDLHNELGRPLAWDKDTTQKPQATLHFRAPDSTAIASNDNRWHVTCDLITSDLSHFPDPRVIYSLVPKPPQTGDTEHFTHMRPNLEWYPVNKLDLIHTIYISVVDSQFKPVVFNSGTVSVRLRYNGRGQV